MSTNTNKILMPCFWSPAGETGSKPAKHYKPVSFKPSASMDSCSTADPPTISTRPTANPTSNLSSSHASIKLAKNNQSLNTAPKNADSRTLVASTRNLADDNNSKQAALDVCDKISVPRKEECLGRRGNEIKDIKSLLSYDENVNTLSSLLQHNDDTDSNLSEDCLNARVNGSTSVALDSADELDPTMTTRKSWFSYLRYSNQKQDLKPNSNYYNCYPYIEISSSVRKDKSKKDKTCPKKIKEEALKSQEFVKRLEASQLTPSKISSKKVTDMGETKKSSKCIGDITMRQNNAHAKYEMEVYKNQPLKIEDYEPGLNSSIVLNKHSKENKNSNLRWYESDADIDYRDDEGVFNNARNDSGYLSSSCYAESTGRWRKHPAWAITRQNDSLERVLAEEREAKMRREIRENEARRHHDTLTHNQKLNFLLSRYEGLPCNENFTKSRVKGKARVMFTFKPHHQNELALNKGDIVHLLRRVDANWYKGEINGRMGVFPSNYVDVIISLEEARRLAEDREGKAIAVYDFVGRSSLELSLKKGDEVMLIRNIDDNWYEGRLRGRQGIFPASYVDVLGRPISQSSTPIPGESSGMSRSSSIFSVGPELPSPWNSDFYESEFEREHTATPLCKLFSIDARDNGFPTDKRTTHTNKLEVVNKNPNIGQLPNASRISFSTQNIQTTNNNSITDTNNTNLTTAVVSQDEELRSRTGGVQGSCKPATKCQSRQRFRIVERCCALYSYEPQNDDELKLREGDLISIVEKCDDGWYIGLCEKTGLFGTFPGNYVQLIG